MYCSNCGMQIPNNVNACPECGALQNRQQPVQQNQQVQFYQTQYQPVQPQYQPQPYAQQSQYSASGTAYEPHHGYVGFGQAIVLFFRNYVNFTGRASKSEYWWAFLFQSLAAMVVYIPVIGWLAWLGLILPNISISIRRLHDTGKAWYYYLFSLIPFAGIIIMITFYLKPSDYDNQWGPGPDIYRQNYQQWNQQNNY